jgi:hypothetical protein
MVGNTSITLVQDTSANPPLRDQIKINSDADVLNLFYLNNMSLDASLAVVKSVEAVLSGSFWGLRWQFLNHGQKEGWVAAVQGAIGSSQRTKSSSVSGGSSSSTFGAETEVNSTQAAVSLGYQFVNLVPYLSLITENHQATTTVTNNSGNFGPYEDQGRHQYLALGITSIQSGFSYAFEVNTIQIDWDRAQKAQQTSGGARIGYAW